MKRELVKPHIEVRNSLVAGYGVFAAKNLRKGEIIEECPVLMIDEESAKTHNHYLFPKNNNEGYFLPLGYGSLYTQASLPNARWEFDKTNNLMVFKAIKPIHRGEEIFIYHSSTWISTDKIEANSPKLGKKIATIFFRLGLVLFLFYVLKLAFFTPKQSNQDNLAHNQKTSSQLIHHTRKAT